MLVSLPARVPQPALRRSFLPLATAVALFAVYLLTYSGQFHSIDENAVFAVSRNLVEHGRVDIGALFWGAPYFDQGRLGPDGELYSKYGLGHSLLLAPLVWLGLHLPGVGVVQTAVLLDGLATAATGALLVVLAGRLGFPRAGPWLAALYGLGTFAWVYARTLFGEPLSALLFTAALALAPGPEACGGEDGPGARHGVRFECGWWLVGTLLGLNILVRPVNVLFAPLFALLLPWRGTRGWGDAPQRRLCRAALSLGTPGILGVVGALGYNWLRFGDPLIFGYVEGFHQPLLAGLVAFLASLDRSMFLYAPPLLVLPATVGALWRRAPRVALLTLGLGVATLVVYAKWDAFWGGPVWGPRYLLPALPLLILLLAPAAEAAARGARRWQLGLGLAGLAGAAVNAGGVFFDRYAYLQRFGQRYPLLVRPPRLAESDWAWVQPGPDGLRVAWLPLALATLLLVAATCSARARRWTRDGHHGWSAVALVGLVALVTLLSLREAAAIGFGFAPRPGYPEVARTVAAEGNPGDVLVLDVAPFEDFGQTLSWFANNDQAPVPTAGLFRAPPPDDESAARLMALAARYHRIWLMTEGVPPGDPASTAEVWLSRHTFALDDRWLGSVRLSRFVSEPPGSTTGGPAALEGGLTLARWAVPERVAAGASIPVELEWRSREFLPVSLRVFVQLLDPTGRLIVGRDSEPQNGYAPTAGWSPGEPVLDRHALLAPSVLGVYRVITGLYDPSTGRRLSATGTDFIELGRVRVVPP